MTPKREPWRTYMLRDVKHRNAVRPRGHQVWEIQLVTTCGHPFFRVGFRGESQWDRRMSRNVFKELEK